MQCLLKTENLNYKNILKNINIMIKKGTVISISGSNNCGKTTLIKLLCGLLIEKESVFYKNEALESLTDKKIGFVIPSLEIPFHDCSIEEELMYALDRLEMDLETKRKHYKKIISFFKLKNMTKEDPAKLYLFAKIKLRLALAIIEHKEMILLDDISSGLTKKENQELFLLLKEIKEAGITIVMTTSNLEETLFSDYLYILDEGSIVLEGKTIDVLQEDSKLNKLGLTLPFMVDLSLKLKYYELVDNIETDMDRLVDILWK